MIILQLAVLLATAGLPKHPKSVTQAPQVVQRPHVIQAPQAEQAS